MAIVQLQPDAQPLIDTTTPSTIEEPHKSIFTKLTPESNITSLSKYVEGYPWTVNYYGQILNRNNTLENFDPYTPNLNQPYYEIVNAIIQVSSPLSSDYDQATGVTTVTGSAVMPYGLISNVGDLFIAKVDSGEDAIFMINSVSRKSFHKDSLYEVNYILLYYLSDNPVAKKSLEGKVQDTYYFNKDTNFFNRDMLIKPSVKEAIDRLKSLVIESQEFYFSTFPTKEAGTLTIPGVDYKVYDPYLINFIMTTVSYSDLNNTPLFRHNYCDDRYINQKTIFDVLIYRNQSVINTINKRIGFVRSGYLDNRGRLGTISYTRADYIAYPIDPNTNNNIKSIHNDPVKLDYYKFISNEKNQHKVPIKVNSVNSNQLYNKPLIHTLFKDDYYLVTENFYKYFNNNDVYDQLSYIELLLYKTITKQAIAKEDLVIAIEKYLEFNSLSQVYLLPVLWYMIKINI